MDGTAVAMTVASMATRAVESMIPMRTGPRSDRKPTPDDAAARPTLTVPRLGRLRHPDRAAGAVAEGRHDASADASCPGRPPSVRPGAPATETRPYRSGWAVPVTHSADGRAVHRRRPDPCSAR